MSFMWEETMKERYVIQEGSNSGHCCFEYSIVDTHRKNQSLHHEYHTICECFYEKDAVLIKEALEATRG